MDKDKLVECLRCHGTGVIEGHDVRVTSEGMRVRKATKRCACAAALRSHAQPKL